MRIRVNIRSQDTVISTSGRVSLNVFHLYLMLLSFVVRLR